MAEGERGASSVAAPADVPAFVRGLSFEQLPDEVVASARRSLLDLIGAATTRHALGVAEYFGPRGQILRACDSPTMVKDGSGWGAHVGLAAALLARDGFTGAPALTVERDDAGPFWSDLGTRWRIGEQYFKAYPVCRWAQPAIEAALDLQRAHR